MSPEPIYNADAAASGPRISTSNSSLPLAFNNVITNAGSPGIKRKESA